MGQVIRDGLRQVQPEHAPWVSAEGHHLDGRHSIAEVYDVPSDVDTHVTYHSSHEMTKI